MYCGMCKTFSLYEYYEKSWPLVIVRAELFAHVYLCSHPLQQYCYHHARKTLTLTAFLYTLASNLNVGNSIMMNVFAEPDSLLKTTSKEIGELSTELRKFSKCEIGMYQVFSVLCAPLVWLAKLSWVERTGCEERPRKHNGGVHVLRNKLYPRGQSSMARRRKGRPIRALTRPGPVRCFLVSVRYQTLYGLNEWLLWINLGGSRAKSASGSGPAGSL